MRVALVGKDTEDFRTILDRVGMEVVAPHEGPSLIIAHGGDGSFIGAEAAWPGVPKLGIRGSRSCHKCDLHDDETVLRRVLAGEAVRTELMKLEAAIADVDYLGVNDILMRNADIHSAVRFNVSVNGERVTDEIIGDGLVIATPFGSSAYFRSITNTTFRDGIGVAFNNCTEFLNHLVLRAEDVVRIDVVRGPAQVTADNTETVTRLEDGAAFTVRRSERTATVLSIDTLRCPFCRYKHAPRRRF